MDAKTETKLLTNFDICEIVDPTERFVAVMRERENIRLRREQGLSRPWTSDPFLQHYRFCNIRREDDRTTRWIAEHWRTPHQPIRTYGSP